MRMNHVGVGRLLSLLAAFSAGCNSTSENTPPPPPAPKLVFKSGTAEVGTQGFGSIATLKEASFSVSVFNSGNAGAVLGAVTDLDFSLEAPFSLGTSLSSPCVTGAVIKPSEFCTLQIQFSPMKPAQYSDTLILNYDKVGSSTAATAPQPEASPSAAPAYKTLLSLTGSSFLDCSVREDLTASYSDGTQAGIAKNAEETAAGKKAGEALTYEDGVSDGYKSGYSGAYQKGYDSADGYKKGYDVGYGLGYQAALNNPANCLAGSASGTKQGQSDGQKTGDYDGYHDGYSIGKGNGAVVGDGDGYKKGLTDGTSKGYSDGASSGDSKGYSSGKSDGYYDGKSDAANAGYSDGYVDGKSSCSDFSGSSSSAPDGSKREIPFRSSSEDPSSNSSEQSPVELLDGCYNQGFQKSHNTSSYQNAYNTAKKENVPYQDGYKKGDAQGQSDGYPVGVAAGYSAGVSAGKVDGNSKGADDRFKACYATAYYPSYDSSYKSAYNKAYPEGYDAGYWDGYDQSYDAGYNDGFDYTYTSAFNQAYDSAYDSAYYDGYDSGYASGYDDAYDDNYSDGYDDAVADYCGDWNNSSGSSSGSGNSGQSGYYSSLPREYPSREFSSHRQAPKEKRMQRLAEALAKIKRANKLDGRKPRNATRVQAPKPTRGSRAPLANSSRFGQGHAWWKSVTVSSGILSSQDQPVNVSIPLAVESVLHADLIDRLTNSRSVKESIHLSLRQELSENMRKTTGVKILHRQRK